MKKLHLVGFTIMLSALLMSGCFGSNGEEGKKAEPPKEEKKVYLVQTAPPNMLEQLKAGEIDGFIAWEPFNSTAVESGDGKYLFTSEDVWDDHPCCVVAVSDNFNDSGTIEALAWAHVKGIRFINEPANKEKVTAYAIDFTGKDKAVVEQALANITFVEYPAREEFEEYYDSLVEGKLLKNSVKDIGFDDSEKFFTGFLQDSVYKKVSAELAKDPDWKPAALSGETKVRLGYLTADLHQLAFFVAEKEGYYREAGLESGKNLETKVFPNGVAVMEAFKAKDIDVAYLGGAPATLKRINDNIPIKVIAGANNEGSGLVVRSDLDIKSVADLKDKTIAVPGVGTVQYTLLDKALREEGLRPVIK